MRAVTSRKHPGAPDLTAATAQRQMWQARNLDAKLPQINADIKEFIASAAAGAAHNTATRILPPLHPSIKDRALLPLTDAEIKTMTRQMTNAGKSQAQAIAELRTTFTKTIQSPPDNITPEQIKWGKIRWQPNGKTNWRYK